MYFREAKVHPNEAIINFNSALILSEDFGAYELARECCERALNSNKHLYDLHYLFAKLLVEEFDDEEAAEIHLALAQKLNSNRSQRRENFVAMDFENVISASPLVRVSGTDSLKPLLEEVGLN